jgi:hypothetical protein
MPRSTAAAEPGRLAGAGTGAAHRAHRAPGPAARSAFGRRRRAPRVRRADSPAAPAGHGPHHPRQCRLHPVPPPCSVPAPAVTTRTRAAGRPPPSGSSMTRRRPIRETTPGLADLAAAVTARAGDEALRRGAGRLQPRHRAGPAGRLVLRPPRAVLHLASETPARRPRTGAGAATRPSESDCAARPPTRRRVPRMFHRRSLKPDTADHGWTASSVPEATAWAPELGEPASRLVGAEGVGSNSRGRGYRPSGFKTGGDTSLTRQNAWTVTDTDTYPTGTAC